MIRIIRGIKKEEHINMVSTREKIKMMSVNQISVYHTLLEAYNIMRNSAFIQIQRKSTNTDENNYSLRSCIRKDLKVPERPGIKNFGFTYNGSRLYNKLPKDLRETPNPHTFKTLTKEWIWKNIPSQ